ncbi:MAG: hypothetical protein DHS20C18_43300 [Saprospiraceae bacterium]|nr:MAG: hypothetical protein DHS20C18_43300 [Saprospiraceae bacterium]
MKKLLTVLIYSMPFLLFGQAQEATLLGTWSRDDLVGSSFYNNTYNEIWGLSNGNQEYAVIGSTAGTHFIDVTDPSQPEEVYFVAGAAQGGQVVHRDYHNYGCYLYAVCDEGNSTMQIMDISSLPDSVSVVYDSDELIKRSHNIFIDTVRARLYTFALFGGPQFNSAMRVYDITDPVDPKFEGEFNNFGGLDAGHVHDGYVHDGIGFMNCGNDGMAMVDFRNPTNPVTLGIMQNYPFAGYNHSGWPTTDMQYYYLGDENWGYDIKVVDITEPENLITVNTFNAEANDNLNLSIPHNQIVACNYLYSSYYYDGLQIYDISDPVNPQRVLYYDTSLLPHDNNYEGAWGVYPFLPSGNILISDMQEGLFVIQGPGDVCSDREESIVSCLSSTTAVNDPSIVSELHIYPNPTNGVLNININLIESQSNVKVELVDLTGRSLTRLSTDNSYIAAGGTQLTFDIPDAIQAGFYLLRISGDNWQRTEKVVIEE